MFLHFRKTWNFMIFMIFMIFCNTCFSIDCLCLLSSILDAFWFPFWKHFRVFGCPNFWCFLVRYFHFFLWILHQKRIPKCDQIRDRVPGRGDPCPRRDRELQIHNLLITFHCFWPLLWTPVPPKTSTKLWKSYFFRSSQNPSQYRMTSVYGLT